MARLHMNISDDLQNTIDEYCKRNNMTRTTFYHIALSHYLEHLKLSSEFENIFKKHLDKSLAGLKKKND